MNSNLFLYNSTNHYIHYKHKKLQYYYIRTEFTFSINKNNKCFLTTIDILNKIAYTTSDRARKVTVYYIVNKKSKGCSLCSFLILREEIRTRNLITTTFF